MPFEEGEGLRSEAEALHLRTPIASVRFWSGGFASETRRCRAVSARLPLCAAASVLLSVGGNLWSRWLVEPKAIHPAPSAAGRRCWRRLGSNDRWCGNRLGLLTQAHC